MKHTRIRSIARKAGREAPAKRIVVVTEGAVTEPEYLNVFRKCFGHRSVVLNINRCVGDPRSVVERAIEKAQEFKGDTLAAYDTVWAMFDRDAHERFYEARDLASRNGIHLAISNPCFEIWGIFHFREYDAPLDRHECQRILESLCSNYERKNKKSFANIQLVKNAYEDAVKRAKTSLSRRKAEGKPAGSPSTTVHYLTEQFRCFVSRYAPKK